MVFNFIEIFKDDNFIAFRLNTLRNIILSEYTTKCMDEIKIVTISMIINVKRVLYALTVIIIRRKA